MNDQETILQDMPLLKEMRRGSERALKTLMDRYMPLVSRTSFRILCDRSDSEAVTEKVFIRLWHDVMTYDDRYTISEWLIRRTCLFSRLRITRRRMLSVAGIRPDLFALSKPKAEHTDDYLTTMAWEIFCRASARMTPVQKIVFTLNVLEGLPDYKVVSITGLFSYRVKIAKARAVSKVHLELARFGRSDDYERYIGFICKISDSLIDLERLKKEVGDIVRSGR